MMQPIRTDACNAALGAPVDWDEATDGECVTLPIHRDTERNLMHSFWMPSEAELANLLAGVPIRLTIFGHAHPPVSISVSSGVDD